IQTNLVDPKKLQATVGDESLAKSSDLKKALEMVVLLEAQMKEMNPNLDSISDYQKKVFVYNEQVEELNVAAINLLADHLVFRVLVQDLEGDKFRKLSEERETIKADPATKNQGVEPTTEHHEGVQITSIPPEVAPVIEENVDYHNDDKEFNPLLDAYLIRDEAEQNAMPSTYVDKKVAEAVKGAHDVKGTDDVDMSNDEKLVLYFLQAIHAAEKRQADLDAHIYSEEKWMMKVRIFIFFVN
ncbi:hypothetical protein Tco_0438671, partial [Tanacetum coccineum]